jgi:drug/metabolite transporter (DMT)-like permease
VVLRRPGRLGLLGIGVGCAGALVIVLSKGQVDRPADPHWLAIGFLIPISLAAGNVYRTLDWPPRTSGLALAVGTNMASAMVILAAAMVAGGELRLSSLATAPALAATQVVASAAMFAVYFRLQAVGGPVYLSQIGYVAAAIGLASGTLILGEHYGLLTWIGGAVVASGVVLTTLDSSRQR